MEKLLKNANVENENLASQFESRLSQTVVFFSLVWNKNRPLALVQLVTKKNGGSEVDHLTQPIKDTDGELSVKLGAFKANDIIEVNFAVLPYSDIQSSAVYINQTNPDLSKKMSPRQASKFKTLKTGKLWISKFKYKVKAPTNA